jgi:hypothetical protein
VVTDLAQTALDFCRECLGWEHCEAIEGSPKGTIVLTQHGHMGNFGDYFHSADLSAVQAAVQRWCDRTDGAFELSYNGFIPGEWEAQVVTPASVEPIIHADPCLALLAACVQAARKLQEVACTR